MKPFQYQQSVGGSNVYCCAYVLNPFMSYGVYVLLPRKIIQLISKREQQG